MVLRRLPLLRRAELHRRHVQEPAPGRAAILRQRRPVVRFNARRRWCRNSQDLDEPAVGGDTWTRGETLNLTWQASQKNKFTMFGHFNQRLVDCNSCSATTSPEAGDLLHAPARVPAAGDLDQSAHQPAAVRGRLHLLQRALDLRPGAEQHQRLRPRRGDLEDRDRPPAYRTDAAITFTTAGNHQYNMRAAVNYVTGSHAFKFGMPDMWGTRNYSTTRTRRRRGPSPTASRRTITEYARPLIDLEHLQGGARPLRAGPLDHRAA